MSPAEMRGSVFDAVLADWTPDPLVYIAAGIATLFYLRGWWILHRRIPERFGHGRLVSFMAGQAADRIPCIHINDQDVTISGSIHKPWKSGREGQVCGRVVLEIKFFNAIMSAC